MTNHDCMNEQECVDFLMRFDIGKLALACAYAGMMARDNGAWPPKEQAMWDLCETVLEFRHHHDRGIR